MDLVMKRNDMGDSCVLGCSKAMAAPRPLEMPGRYRFHSTRRPSLSQLSGDRLDHELRSVERDHVTGALALQFRVDRGLRGYAHELVALAQELGCRHGNDEKPSA